MFSLCICSVSVHFKSTDDVKNMLYEISGKKSPFLHSSNDIPIVKYTTTDFTRIAYDVFKVYFVSKKEEIETKKASIFSFPIV